MFSFVHFKISLWEIKMDCCHLMIVHFLWLVELLCSLQHFCPHNVCFQACKFMLLHVKPHENPVISKYCKVSNFLIFANKFSSQLSSNSSLEQVPKGHFDHLGSIWHNWKIQPYSLQDSHRQFVVQLQYPNHPQTFGRSYGLTPVYFWVIFLYF